jgi:hypothetical protein
MNLALAIVWSTCVASVASAYLVLWFFHERTGEAAWLFGSGSYLFLALAPWLIPFSFLFIAARWARNFGTRQSYTDLSRMGFSALIGILYFALGVASGPYAMVLLHTHFMGIQRIALA